MKVKKIVARYRDGTIRKGTSRNFVPDKKSFNLRQVGGEVVSVDVEELKAVFFVKDFKGNKDRIDSYNDARPWGGKKVQVHFTDGEVLVGYTLHYDMGHHGFFVIPADLQSNNEEVFVITSAAKRITFL